MLWCQGVKNIGLSNHKVKSALMHLMITMHARPRQTDGQTNEDRGNSVRFVLTRDLLATSGVAIYRLSPWF